MNMVKNERSIHIVASWIILLANLIGLLLSKVVDAVDKFLTCSWTKYLQGELCKLSSVLHWRRDSNWTLQIEIIKALEVSELPE